RGVAGDLGHGTAGQALEVLAGPGHTDAQHLETGGAARQADRRSFGSTAPATEDGLARLLHGRVAALAAGQLAAGGAGQQPGPTLSVDLANHPTAPTQDPHQA